jgi:hypothetical protein
MFSAMRSHDWAKGMTGKVDGLATYPKEVLVHFGLKPQG